MPPCASGQLRDGDDWARSGWGGAARRAQHSGGGGRVPSAGNFLCWLGQLWQVYTSHDRPEQRRSVADILRRLPAPRTPRTHRVVTAVLRSLLRRAARTRRGRAMLLGSCGSGHGRPLHCGTCSWMVDASAGCPAVSLASCRVRRCVVCKQLMAAAPEVGTFAAAMLRLCPPSRTQAGPFASISRSCGLQEACGLHPWLPAAPGLPRPHIAIPRLSLWFTRVVRLSKV